MKIEANRAIVAILIVFSSIVCIAAIIAIYNGYYVEHMGACK